jgi:hypothetical protein
MATRYDAFYRACLDRYNELLDQSRVLVEQGDMASARHVLAEADKARPDTIICAFSGKTIVNGDGWSVADEFAWEESP